MSYEPAYQDLGSEIAVTGTATNLKIAELQLAINRIIRGGRADPTTNDGVPVFSGLAKAADQVKESGILGAQTNLSYRAAANIAGVLEPTTLTTTAQVDQATRNLNAVANQRGYPVFDTVRLVGSGGALSSVFGGAGDSKKGGVLGVLSSTTVLAIGAIGVGIAIAVYRKRALPNPRRRRRR